MGVKGYPDRIHIPHTHYIEHTFSPITKLLLVQSKYLLKRVCYFGMEQRDNIHKSKPD